MIKYTLKCDQNHHAESWFKSADAYEALAAAGHLSCPVCGSGQVRKAMMAPRVALKPEGEVVPQENAVAGHSAPVLHQPASEVEKAMAELRARVEETSDYVGDSFASEARAMHLGEKPERSIFGEARLDQARALIEDGVPVLPLPFRPKQKLT